MIWPIASLAVVIIAFVIGLVQNSRKNDEKHAESVRRYIEEKARLDGAPPSRSSESPDDRPTS